MNGWKQETKSLKEEVGVVKEDGRNANARIKTIPRIKIKTYLIQSVLKHGKIK